MRRSTVIGLGAVTVAVLDVVATVEAFRTDRPTLAVVTSLAALVAFGLVASARRPCIEIRPDLADWTARTAAATGEDETSLVDRAVARHRASLDGEQGPDV
jgi:hypothetical protein